MIDVFVDTNILHSKNEQLDKALFVVKLKEIIEEIEINDIYTEIKILLPRMVFNELYQQQLEMFDDLNKKLANVSMPNMQYDRAFNYGEYLETTFKNAIMELQQGIVVVEVVDFPNPDKFNNIISRAIKKEPPFEGKEKHSDKGFKDVLIWESIKEYKEKHINDIIVFYCNDNLLASNALRKEFKEDFRDEIYIEQKDALSYTFSVAELLFDTICTVFPCSKILAIMFNIVCVLPVPGGPCITLMRFSIARFTAMYWLLLHPNGKTGS